MELRLFVTGLKIGILSRIIWVHPVYSEGFLKVEDWDREESETDDIELKVKACRITGFEDG